MCASASSNAVVDRYLIVKISYSINHVTCCWRWHIYHDVCRLKNTMWIAALKLICIQYERVHFAVCVRGGALLRVSVYRSVECVGKCVQAIVIVRF